MTKHCITALAVLTALSACGEGSSSQTANTSVAAAETPPLPIKRTGSAEGVDVTVTDVATPKQIGPAPVGLKAEGGETFVVVSYTIKNTGGKALGLMDRPELSLIDASGTTYAPDQTATPMAAVSMDDPSGIASDLNPNVSANTKAVWKIDKSAFDRGTWKLVLASDPKLTFALK